MGGVRESLGGARAPVSFVDKLTGSDAFDAIFREGMTLVEEAASYLDGEGRVQAKALAREESVAYAAESMRLTTRLMQIASWLLLQRAVNQGELSRAQAMSQRHRVKLHQQELASAPDMFERLPVRLRELALYSLRLQARIIHLDQLISTPPAPDVVVAASGGPVHAQIALLRDAFAR